MTKYKYWDGKRYKNWGGSYASRGRALEVAKSERESGNRARVVTEYETKWVAGRTLTHEKTGAKAKTTKKIKVPYYVVYINSPRKRRKK